MLKITRSFILIAIVCLFLEGCSSEFHNSDIWDRYHKKNSGVSHKSSELHSRLADVHNRKNLHEASYSPYSAELN